ncbi:methyltransferase domain-containing protein [Fusarium globosum]|uniref:Methyltransferase domain-containing protein n=1 Tax=Fusarium globosum TaxID=78864 RepID=A0A8H5UIE6_9HYPO|nr:methyltransferase domain-containing protein [Fusarium globosum]
MAESDDPSVTNILEPEGQPADDSGTDEAIDNASSIQSVTSSVFRYREENGRRYTNYGGGEYLLPNDELYQAPPKNWKRILDVGTGTGVWAMDVGMYKNLQGGASELLTVGTADEHPEAEVLGVDLSPIQPDMVPPNCIFEIDDLEKEWTFKHPFDFIFIRSMIASFKSWPDIFSKAFKNLEPGGYIEVQDNIYPLASDDRTIHGTDILTWSELMVKAANTTGRSITVASKFKSMLEDAGFIDIREMKKRIPMNRWPRDPRYRELGTWSCYMLRSGLNGISMGLLTKLGLTVDEVHVILAGVRRDLRSTKIHGYWYTYDRPLSL